MGCCQRGRPFRQVGGASGCSRGLEVELEETGEGETPPCCKTDSFRQALGRRRSRVFKTWRQNHSQKWSELFSLVLFWGLSFMFSKQFNGWAHSQWKGQCGSLCNQWFGILYASSYVVKWPLVYLTWMVESIRGDS